MVNRILLVIELHYFIATFIIKFHFRIKTFKNDDPFTVNIVVCFKLETFGRIDCQCSAQRLSKSGLIAYNNDCCTKYHHDTQCRPSAVSSLPRAMNDLTQQSNKFKVCIKCRIQQKFPSSANKKRKVHRALVYGDSANFATPSKWM